MTSADLALYLGQMVSSWAAGFCGGYLITKFSDAFNKIV